MTAKSAEQSWHQMADAQIEAAIGSLSESDALRLARYGEFRARALRANGLGIDGDDLIQEALVRTVDGRRHWKKGVTFVKHLIETMRSISNHARDELKQYRALPDSADTPGKKGLDGSLKSEVADAVALAGVREELAGIAASFAGDQTVRSIIEGLQTEMTGPEIQRQLGLTSTEYASAMTRLRRGARRKLQS
jgi:DNA-directed RNA polymerase specialized sigma24 family protein